MIPDNQDKALHPWQTSARYWDKYRALITEMFAPLTSSLVQEAQIRIGQKVLDIGGGSGEPSLTISRIVGPVGSVIKDGCVAFAVWGPKEANPFFSSITDVIDQFLEVPPQDSDAPDTFRFAVPGTLAGILEKAGAKNVIERQLNFQIEAVISFEQFWQVRTEMSESLREKMTRVTPAQLPTIKQAVADAARKYFLSGTMSFPAQALIVSGRKPA